MKQFSSKKTGGFLTVRGFNMFSAIVAIILVMTGVVLTNTLISTEEKTSRQIYTMLNNYELSDAADLARSDAIQSFNYNFREKLENYLTFDNTKLKDEPGFQLFVINSPTQKFDFSSMKTTFENVILLTDTNEGQKFDAALTYVADRTVDQFNSSRYGRFNVSLSDNGPDAKAKVLAATREALSVQQAAQQDFLEVINCDDTACENGSFYFNIPLNKISDSAYEALPQIVVQDVVTGQEMKLPILPRENLKVYIPLRFFRALYEARKVAQSMEAAHASLENYQLGFCDQSTCTPRNSPEAAGGAPLAAGCPATENDPATQINLTAPAGISLPVLGISGYRGGQTTGRAALAALGAQRLCDIAVTQNAFKKTSNDFHFKEDPVLGLMLKQNDQRQAPVPGCGLEELVVVANPAQPTHIIDDSTSSGTRLYCSRITSVIANVVLEETNPLYIVKGTAEAGTKDYYKIQIADIDYPHVDGSDTTAQNSPHCTTSGASCNIA